MGDGLAGAAHLEETDVAVPHGRLRHALQLRHLDAKEELRHPEEPRKHRAEFEVALELHLGIGVLCLAEPLRGEGAVPRTQSAGET